MGHKLEKIVNHITTKKLLFIFYLLIIFHVLFVMYLLKENNLDQKAEKRSALIQKMVNAIYLIEAMPENRRMKAIKAMDDPQLQISITATPTTPWHFQKDSFWKIIDVLEHRLQHFAISVQLDTQQWLNVKGNFYSRDFTNQLILIACEFIIMITVLLTIWSLNRFTVPLKKIKSSAEQLGIDVTVAPIDIYGPKMVREVSQALNQMQQRIAELVSNRTQLLAAISHDLRTPIMRARLRLQFMEDGDYKNQLQNDLEEMEHMISETLSFAREDSKREEKKNIELVSLLQSICNDAVDLGNDVVYHENAHRIAFFGRPIALKRAFTNLLNNAVRYAGNAVVTISKQHKNIIITIEDSGPGISLAELEKVFEPFYRGEHSRSRNTGGVGLGLSVARDIILAHGGKIILKNRQPHGLCVSVHLSIP